jgi:hypothetical protein
LDHRAHNAARVGVAPAGAEARGWSAGGALGLAPARSGVGGVYLRKHEDVYLV